MDKALSPTLSSTLRPSVGEGTCGSQLEQPSIFFAARYGTQRDGRYVLTLTLILIVTLTLTLTLISTVVLGLIGAYSSI